MTTLINGNPTEATTSETPSSNIIETKTDIVPGSERSDISSEAQNSGVEEDDDLDDNSVPVLERDHPSFEGATISVILQLLPKDQDPNGRLVLAAVKSHNLPPVTTMVRLNTLTPLPDCLQKLLSDWQNTLSSALRKRNEDRTSKAQRKKAEEAQRKVHKSTTQPKKKTAIPVGSPTAPATTSQPVTTLNQRTHVEPQAQLF